jgi:hypothetical protein
MKKIEEIINLLKSNDLEGVDFLCLKNKPTIQKNGDRYEVFSISPTDDGTLEITGMKVYPSYEFKLSYLTVDSRWRSTSIDHIKEIIQEEINRIEQLFA